MSSPKAKYKGFFYQVIKEDARFVTLEGLGATFRVKKEEVIYDKKKEDKISDKPKEDNHELVKQPEEKPLPKDAEDKGFVAKPEEDKPVADQNPNKGEVPVQPHLKDDKLSDELEKLRLEMRTDFGNLDQFDEEGEGGPVATGDAAGPSTNTASVARFDAKIGANPQKRKLEEVEDEEVIDEDGDGGGGDAGATGAADAPTGGTGTTTADIAVVPTVIGSSPTHKPSCITAGGSMLLKQSNPLHKKKKTFKEEVMNEDGETGTTGGGGSVGMSPPAGVPPNAATPEEIALYAKATSK